MYNLIELYFLVFNGQIESEVIKNEKNNSDSFYSFIVFYFK